MTGKKNESPATHVDCCGAKHTTNFCPTCGQQLRDAACLPALIKHLRSVQNLQQHWVDRWSLRIKEAKDGEDTRRVQNKLDQKIKNRNRWRDWADAIESLFQSRVADRNMDNVLPNKLEDALKWISVAAELPAIDRDVLCWTKYQLFVGRRSADENYPNGWAWWMRVDVLDCDVNNESIFGEVTHWMGLPASPSR